MWDPVAYRRFGTERSRPFDDLLHRVGASDPRAVVDLGCGPGDLTARLAARWPGAQVTGWDSSTEMIEQARSLGAGVDFRAGDLRDWRPEPDVDVVVSNATLQWVPEHRALLVDWARHLAPGAWLAIQVPGNFDAPSHRALRAVAATPAFAALVSGRTRAAPVDDVVDYATMLAGVGCAVDAWETTYVHLLPADPQAPAEHPVLRWMEGTALRPVRAALDDAGWHAFRAHLGRRLADAYPVRDAVVAFPFRRIFVVARTGAVPPTRAAQRRPATAQETS